MTVENTTENRGYQLPHQDNLLEVDVGRLIAALQAVDVDIATILAALVGKADAAHGHVLADVTGLAAALAAKQDVNEKGQANGYAALGADGKVPSAQLPAAIFGAMSYQGTWNANTNTPMIPAASAANKGHYYKVAVAGSTNVDGESDWKVGDWIVSNGAGWDKIDNTDQVVSVAGLTGAISVAALRAALGVLLLSGGTMTGGISFGSEYADSVGSLARHIALYGATHGFNVTADYLNYHSVNRHRWLIGGVQQVVLSDGLLVMGAGVSCRLSGDPSHNLDAATKQYVDALPRIGEGQTWQDVKASRAMGTSYQNTTGKPIMVYARGPDHQPQLQVSTNGSGWVTVGAGVSGYDFGAGYAIVPAGHYYRLTTGSGSIAVWAELR